MCVQSLVVPSVVSFLSTEVPPTQPGDYPGICPELPQEMFSHRQQVSWLPFKQYCYLFNTDRVEWPDASTNCARLGEDFLWTVMHILSHSAAFNFNLRPDVVVFCLFVCLFVCLRACCLLLQVVLLSALKIPLNKALFRTILQHLKTIIILSGLACIELTEVQSQCLLRHE